MTSLIGRYLLDFRLRKAEWSYLKWEKLCNIDTRLAPSVARDRETLR